MTENINIYDACWGMVFRISAGRPCSEEAKKQLHTKLFETFLKYNYLPLLPEKLEQCKQEIDAATREFQSQHPQRFFVYQD